MSSFSLREAASPYLNHLQVNLGNTVFLGVLAEDQLLYIDKREGGMGGISFTSNIGNRRPPYWGMLGPVLMSYLPEGEVDRLLEAFPLARVTKKSYTDKEEFKGWLRAIRRQGYVIEDGTAFESIGGIAAPIRDFTRKVVAAVGVGFIFSSADSRSLNRMVKEVMAAAGSISTELGYVGQIQQSPVEPDRAT